MADADFVEDSEDVSDTHFSSGDNDNDMIPAQPLDSRPPLRVGKKILLRFSLGTT
jgi:hypothetical protein